MNMGHWEAPGEEYFFTEDELNDDLEDAIIQETHDRFDEYINERYDAATLLHMLLDGEKINPNAYFKEVKDEVEKEVRSKIVEGEDLDLLGWRYIWIDDDDEPEPMVICPGCHKYCGGGEMMGRFGNMSNYRCSACGVTFQRERSSNQDRKSNGKRPKKGKRKPLINLRRK